MKHRTKPAFTGAPIDPILYSQFEAKRRPHEMRSLTTIGEVAEMRRAYEDGDLRPMDEALFVDGKFGQYIIAELKRDAANKKAADDAKKAREKGVYCTTPKGEILEHGIYLDDPSVADAQKSGSYVPLFKERPTPYDQDTDEEVDPSKLTPKEWVEYTLEQIAKREQALKTAEREEFLLALGVSSLDSRRRDPRVAGSLGSSGLASVLKANPQFEELIDTGALPRPDASDETSA